MTRHKINRNQNITQKCHLCDARRLSSAFPSLPAIVPIHICIEKSCWQPRCGFIFLKSASMLFAASLTNGKTFAWWETYQFFPPAQNKLAPMINHQESWRKKKRLKVCSWFTNLNSCLTPSYQDYKDWWVKFTAHTKFIEIRMWKLF